jgi:hypothetical protein
MKKNITLCLVLFSFISHSQIGLGGLKNKLKKKEQTEQNSNTEGSNNPFEKQNLSDEEKENIEISKSPAASDIHGLKKSFRSLKAGVDAMTKSFCKNCDVNIKVGDRNIENIKSRDPSYAKLDEMEKAYNLEKARYANLYDGYKIIEGFDGYYRSLNSFLNKKNDRDYFAFFKKNSNVRRDTLFNASNEHDWDTSHIERYEIAVKKIKSFYTENNDKLVALALPEILENYEQAKFWCAAFRATTEFEERTTSESHIKPTLAAIGQAMGGVESAIAFEPENLELKKQYALVKERYDDINLFVDSGEFDKLLARKKAEEIERVRMAKPGSSNATYKSMATKNAQEQLGKGEKLLKTIITSSDWTVQKNDLDIPINKIMYYQIAFKDADGNCWLGKGFIVKTYEGGGKYGPAHANYAGKSSIHGGAINCDNVNK